MSLAGPLDELRADMDTWCVPIQPHEVLNTAESVVRRQVDEHTTALDAAYRECAHSAAWLAAHHPSVIAWALLPSRPRRAAAGSREHHHPL